MLLASNDPGKMSSPPAYDSVRSHRAGCACGRRLNFTVRSRVETNSIPGEAADYAEAWRRLEALGRSQIYVLISGIPIALLLSFLSIKYVETAFIVCWFLAFAILGARYRGFRCPRCHKKFFQPNGFAWSTFLKACPHCGLERGAVSMDATSNNRWSGP